MSSNAEAVYVYIRVGWFLERRDIRMKSLHMMQIFVKQRLLRGHPVGNNGLAKTTDTALKTEWRIVLSPKDAVIGVDIPSS